MEKCDEENVKKKLHNNGVEDVNPKKIEPKRSSPPWEDLPYHLLELFLKPIFSPMDRPNLSRVCKSWKEFKYSNYFPTVVHKNTICRSIKGDEVDKYPVKECLGSSHGWLIIRIKKNYGFAREKRYALKDSKEIYYLLNIYTHKTIRLPDLLNIIPPEPKICLSSSPIDPDCFLLMFDHSFTGFLFSMPGTDKWIECEYDFYSKPNLSEFIFIYESIISFGGKFCGLDHNRNLFVIDIIRNDKDEQQTIVTRMSIGGIFPTKIFELFLVESQGKLLVVTIHKNEKRTDIKKVGVFEIEFETKSLIEMKNLPGDQVLFIEHFSSFSISGSEIGMSNKNGGERGRYVYVSGSGKVQRYDMQNEEMMVITNFPVFGKCDGGFHEYLMVKPTYV